MSRARERCRFSSSLHGWALPSASPRPLMCRLWVLAFQLIPTLPTPLLLASNRVPIQTQHTLLCVQIVLASREPSLAPLAMRFVPWITRRLAALEGRRGALMVAILILILLLAMVKVMEVILMARGAPTKQLSQGTPTPNTSTMGQQELTPMPLLTMELPSPTLLILRLQLSLAMLS